MSIYIKGMELPKDKPLTLVIYPDGTVANVYEVQRGTAIHVPPHGGLNDQNQLRKTMFIGEQCLYCWDEIDDAIDHAPTIIPAEEGEG